MNKMNITSINTSDLCISELNVRKEITTAGEESDLTTLANDIDNNGLINPLSVRLVGDKYEIYAGQRRFMAIKTLGWEEIPCIVTSVDDTSAEIISLAENIQRTKLSARDKCRIYTKYYELNNKDIDELARLTSITRPTLQRYITIENTLSPELLDRLDATDERHITISMALDLSNNVPVNQQSKILSKVQRVSTATGRRTILREFSQNINNPSFDIDERIDLENIVNLEKYDIDEQFPPYVYNAEGEFIEIPEILFPSIVNMINKYNMSINTTETGE